MRDNVFRLITLGRIALVGPGGGEDESLRKRRRKLALLVVLALSGRPLTRDLLTEMFWGDQDDGRARHSLSDALSHLRRVIGREAITARQSEVVLSPDARLNVDALELAAAHAASDSARVVSLYTGPFLDGVYVDGSASFEQWVARERERLDRVFLKACEARCMALARARQWDDCGALAGRWLAAAPLSADAALYVLNALKAPATREADARALAEYQRMVCRLRDEYALGPDPRVAALAEDIARRLRETEVAASVSVAAGAGSETDAREDVTGPESLVMSADHSSPSLLPAEHIAMPATPTARPAHRWWRRLAAACVVFVAAGSGSYATRHALAGGPALSSLPPAVAVTSMEIVHGDSGSAWLGGGLMQLMSADLARSTAVRVIAPDRVRAAAARAGYRGVFGIPPDTALAIGRRVGARWVITGGLTHGDTMYILDVSVRDAESGKVARLYTVTATNLTALSDEAASHALDAVRGGGGPQPRLADVNTSSIEAYEHYVRAVQADGEGRFADERRELDQAIALDSGFVSALAMRLSLSTVSGGTHHAREWATALWRASGRASDWDRRQRAVRTAQHNGERARSERLARDLVARYPRDPRSYGILADLYTLWGAWDTADTLLERALALDSLGAETEAGPCAPCIGYNGLVNLHALTGDLATAERAARRWIALEPDLPAAWSSLAFVLQASGQYDAALTASHHAAMLAGNDPVYADRAVRILIAGRRYDAADTAIASWGANPVADLQESALDLRAMLERERGELRAASRTLATLVARFPDAGVLRLERATTLADLGDYEGAMRLFESEGHPAPAPAAPPVQALTGDWARNFCWTHALEADAIAATGDTVRLRALADSIEEVGGRSYYGRDWRLAHHVRGLIAMRGGRYEDAIHELEQARWGSSGWTATLRELARAELALGRPMDAVRYLRHAYEAPLDAMGRYVPRSQLDLLMAIAFQRAGVRDSSAVYARHVRRAWQHADPEVKHLLAQLDDAR